MGSSWALSRAGQLGDPPGVLAIFSVGAASAGALRRPAHQGVFIHRRVLHLQKHRLGLTHHPRRQLQPHLRHPQLAPAVGGLSGKGQKTSQHAPQQKPRQRLQIPLLRQLHKHYVHRRRCRAAQPQPLFGQKSHQICQRHHRAHRYPGDLRQVQRQPRHSRCGKGCAAAQCPGCQISKTQIGDRQDLRQSQYPNAAGDPVQYGISPLQDGPE